MFNSIQTLFDSRLYIEQSVNNLVEAVTNFRSTVFRFSSVERLEKIAAEGDESDLQLENIELRTKIKQLEQQLKSLKEKDPDNPELDLDLDESVMSDTKHRSEEIQSEPLNLGVGNLKHEITTSVILDGVNKVAHSRVGFGPKRGSYLIGVIGQGYAMFENDKRVMNSSYAGNKYQSITYSEYSDCYYLYEESMKCILRKKRDESLATVFMDIKTWKGGIIKPLMNGKGLIFRIDRSRFMIVMLKENGKLKSQFELKFDNKTYQIQEYFIVGENKDQLFSIGHRVSLGKIDTEKQTIEGIFEKKEDENNRNRRQDWVNYEFIQYFEKENIIASFRSSYLEIHKLLPEGEILTVGSFHLGNVTGPVQLIGNFGKEFVIGAVSTQTGKSEFHAFSYNSDLEEMRELTQLTTSFKGGRLRLWKSKKTVICTNNIGEVHSLKITF